MRRLITLSVLALAVSCAHPAMTPYQPFGRNGGYTDQALGDGTYLVTVRVNGYTDATTAYSYFNRRALELCTAHGFKSFAVIDRDESSRKGAVMIGHSMYMVEAPRVMGRIRCTNEAPGG